MKIEITDNATEISHEEILHFRNLNAGYFARMDGTMPEEFKGCYPEEIVAQELTGTTRKLRFKIAAAVHWGDTALFKSREYILDEVTTTHRGNHIESFVHARHEDSQPCGIRIFRRDKAAA